MYKMVDLFNTDKELESIYRELSESKHLLENNVRMKVLEERAIKEAEFRATLPPLPDKKYQVIYADPPWRYDFSRSNSREIENQYPTMDLEEIKNLQIDKLAEDDSVMFLWATSPKLEDAMEVIKAYGFKYVTSAVWDKIKIGMGYYFRSRHEYLLVSKKGNLPVPAPENRSASIIEIPRGKHSKKPVEFYTIIERMYPNETKIELFSRIKRDGWDTWGFEEGTLSAPEYHKLWSEKWEE